ncbi:ABC transporter permease [Rhizobium leguminosarum]|uniref:ABC transporter permease n=1 Tax=Rhizobium leguminosarum TaxID=384 RepID=UPI0014423637|nr:ABC transporter permease [Rhizobium leguminosarum]MBY5869521.1 ABC transporter permease [Rhizobium leguminosarum]NKM09406.1 ABC transporter permease [Rhizobium leguminosarum bv. viciae]
MITEKVTITSSLSNIWACRQLLMQLWKRDFAARYKTGVLGIAWAVINPLLMLALYSFVFVSVFKMRWGSGPDVQGNFVILLFTGLMVHGFFAEFLSRAPLLISSNPSYVKKVVFPLELLPLMPLLGAIINLGIGVFLVSCLLFYVQGSVPLTIFLLPLILAPYIVLVVGMSYFLSATGVFVRDMTHVVGLVTTISMFASPVLFPLENVPENYRIFLYLNPLTTVVVQLREVTVLGIIPDLRVWAAYFFISMIVFCLGLSWFQATREGFADVL